MFEGLVAVDSNRKRRVWTDNSIKEVDTPTTSQRTELTPNLEQLQEDNWSWCQSNQLSNHDVQFIDSRTVFFHPQYSYGTAAVVGSRKLTKNVIAFWEIHVEFVYGTSMMFGIGKECSRLVSPILFENLIGGDSHSYGLSHKGILYHNGIISKYCQPFKEQQPVIVGLSFDGPRKELSYFVDGKCMGIAFENLNLDDTVYYPMISSTSQKSPFTVTQQKYQFVVAPLAEQCLIRVANLIKSQAPTFEDINSLKLPQKLVEMVESRLDESSETCPKRLKLEKAIEIMEVDQIEPDLMNELSLNIRDQLIKIAWAQSISSQL